MSLVEFIIPTYDRIEALDCMLASLQAQTDKDFKVFVVIDDIRCDRTDVIVNICKRYNNIHWYFTERRYNDWGHTPREIGKQLAKSDYIIMTGDDNYYTPNFVAELRKAAETKPGMIYWDMVHSHYDYQYFKCTPAFNQIDMGAFATRRDLAQQIKLNTSYAADGEYVRDFNTKFPLEQKIKISKVLFVHN